MSSAAHQLAGMTANMLSLARNAPLAAEGALYEVASRWMTEMQRRTPVDTGLLVSSGTVDLPQRQGTTITVLAGFGGAADEYAIYVHEDMEAQHTVGQAKFVSSVLDEHEASFEAEVGAAFARRLGL